MEENSKQIGELLHQGDCLVTGTYKRVDRTSGDHIIVVQSVECRMRRSDAIPKERFRRGGQISCVISEIQDDPQTVYLTRTTNIFLNKLYHREVSEIADGTIEIVSVARDPGNRSKIAVRSRDKNVNLIGACIGKEGVKVKSVIDEMSGEKVDIIPWYEDEMQFVKRSLWTGRQFDASGIVYARKISDRSCEVIVKEDLYKKTIGTAGINVNLAKELTGWKISIKKIDAREIEQLKRKNKQAYFVEQLGIDESAAQILYDEGFNTIEDLADASIEELLDIEEFDEAIANQILDQAKDARSSTKNARNERLERIDEQSSSNMFAGDLHLSSKSKITAEEEPDRKAADAISSMCKIKPEAVIIIGAGLERLVESFEAELTIDYSKLPGFSMNAEESHPRCLSMGKFSGKGVAVLRGQEYIEGHSVVDDLRMLRILAMLEAKTLLVTNCAGKVPNEEHNEPTIMLIEDHINLTGQDFATGLKAAATRDLFSDMDSCYDPQLYAAASEHFWESGRHALPQGHYWSRGVFAAVSRATFKSPAERRILALWGANAVGNSTVHEVISARQAGMRVLGLSGLVYNATESQDPSQDDKDIDKWLEMVDRVADTMAVLLMRFLKL